MSHHSLVFAVLAGISFLAVGTSGIAMAVDPLGVYQWKYRVLLVSAPDINDKMLEGQRHVFAAMRAGALDRDLVLVEAVGRGPDAEALRQRFGVTSDGFQALLIGKDGGEKLRSSVPLGPDHLFPTIDAMPMRRDEMARKP